MTIDHEIPAMQKQALVILKRIVPWLTESNAQKTEFRNNHKGIRGRIGVVGGARDYAGAPYFASMSAMRLGADLSYVICSQSSSQAIKTYSPDLIVTPILDKPQESEFTSEIDCLLSRLHSLVIGPGLGREDLMQSRAATLIQEAKSRSIPLILDADSLLLVNKDPSIVKNYPEVLLTPNRIELQRMLEAIYAPKTFDLRFMQTEEIIKLVEQCSADLGVTILAKGASDIICDGSSRFKLLTDKNSGSSRRCGGQGDITCGLAGVYSHWISMVNRTSTDKIENKMAWAGYLAAITTRRCNEIAYEEYHSGTLASDMINKVHVALKTLLMDASAPVNNVIDSSVKQSMYAGVFSRDEVRRYARQMIIDDFGPSRQMNLKKSSVLIIGAGGLGCPAAVYLAAGGVGCVGIVDDDRVEASNLHRQILHSMRKIGWLKTESIKEAILEINPNVEVNCHSFKLDRHNAVDLIERYDIIVDCTDNLLTRYMISDACVVAKKPLVSGAALKTDGQLTVYNYDDNTPCFRCLFPEPPPPNAVGSCSENGVLGVLPGIIGVNQAIEAIKIGAGIRPAYAGKMLIFDGQLGLYRHIKLVERKSDCAACGPNAKLGHHLIDYDEFCGQMLCRQTSKPDDILLPQQRVTVNEYNEILRSKRPHVLVDVRPQDQSEVSRFGHAIQAPVGLMLQQPEIYSDRIRSELKSKNTNEIFVVCRKGIASQRGVKILEDFLRDEPGLVIRDIAGGMTGWAELIDTEDFACI